MTHELVSAYDMLDQMHVLVRCPTSDAKPPATDHRIDPPFSASQTRYSRVDDEVPHRRIHPLLGEGYA